MLKLNCKRIALLFVIYALSSCSATEKETGSQPEAKNVLSAQVYEVTVMPLKKKVFNHELISNGKVTATSYADLSFRIFSEPVTHIYVKNGDRVKKGQKIAELDMFTLQNELKMAEIALRKAELDMKDVLIGQGYAPDRLQNIPQDILHLAEIKSGYGLSKSTFEMKKYELEQAVITAPFDGVIANLEACSYNRPSGARPFCRVIGNEGMDVSFKILESEVPLVDRGCRIEITPFAGTVSSAKGIISEINPQVDENGLVRVKARIAGQTKLFDGMNVRVNVKRAVANQWVVPKTAVVLRSGKQVVFTLKDGKAMWNYVTTGLENLTEYTVTGEGLAEGAEVITTGNVNLAHEAPVVVIP